MEIKIHENVSLAPLTTLNVGGAARFFVEVKNETEISGAVSFARQNALPIFILGGGSNVLISDRGFDGLILKIANQGIEISEKESTTAIKAQAGEDWDKFVDLTVARNLQGIECLSGIPGTIGGTPVQNVGAYGQEVSETISKVRVYDLKNDCFLELSNDDCKFSYRTSLFNSSEKNRFIVTAVTFHLKNNGKPNITYKDLQNFFAGHQPTLTEIRRAVLRIRRAKSMVIDENDPNSKSAGSFFKNPVITRTHFELVEEASKKIGIKSVPKYEVDENQVKIPAAWLIEKAGFYKGYQKGKAGLSSNHTLALINLNDAQAADIIQLKSEIQQKVQQTFQIDLITEPVFVGF